MNEFRAADSRFHSTASTVRSACGAAFHSSSSSAIRSPLCFQCVASAEMRSASSTIRSLTPRASLLACSRAALTSSRRWSTTPVSASSRVLSASRSPIAFASATAASSRCTVAWAWAGATSVVFMRCSSSATSVSSEANLRRKNTSASSGLPAAHEPITRSPSAVRT